MTQPASPPFSGQPSPVAGVTGGPPAFGGQISNDPNDGSIVVAPNPGNVFQLRKGTNPQALQIYERFDNNTNYTRLEFNSQANGPFVIQTASQGGVPNGPRDLTVQAGGVMRIGSTGNNPLAFLTNNTQRWQFTAAGFFNPIVDNTYDIGTNTGPFRPRNIIVGSAVLFGGVLQATGATATVDFTNATSVIANLPKQFISGSNTTLAVGVWTDIIGTSMSVATGTYIVLMEILFINSGAAAATMSANVAPSTTGTSGTPVLASPIGNCVVPQGAQQFYGITSYLTQPALGNIKVQAFTSLANTTAIARLTLIRIL